MGDAVVKHVFQTGPIHYILWRKDGSGGVTTTNLRVRARYRVVLRASDGRDKRVFFHRRTSGWGGERKKPPPSESRRGYRSISVPESVRGCACVCVFFPPFRVLPFEYFYSQTPRRNNDELRVNGFIHLFIIIIIFCSCSSSSSSNRQRATRCELSRGKGVRKNLSRLIFFYNDF